MALIRLTLKSTDTGLRLNSETFSQDFFCENIVLKNSNQRQCVQIDKKGKEKFVKVTQEAFKLSVFVA